MKRKEEVTSTHRRNSNPTILISPSSSSDSDYILLVGCYSTTTTACLHAWSASSDTQAASMADETLHSSLIKCAGDRQTEDDHEGFGQCLLAQWSKFSKLPHIPSNCEEADFEALTSLQYNDRMTPLNLYSRLPGTKENSGNYNYSRALKRDPKTWQYVVQHLTIEICLNPTYPELEEEGREEENLTLRGGTLDVNQNVENRGNCNNCGSLRIEKNRLVLQHSAMKIRQNPTDKRNAGMEDELPQTLKLRRSRILGARKSTVLQQQSRRKSCTSRPSGTKENRDKCTFKGNPKNMGLCGAKLGNGDILKPYRHRDGRGRRKQLTLGGLNTRCE